MPHQVDRHFPDARPSRSLYAPTVGRPTPTQLDTLRPRITETPERATTPPRLPTARPRPAQPHPAIGEKYGRYEEITGSAGTGGIPADLGSFSGYPDAIDLVATGGDALISLRDSTGREESTLRLIVNFPRETHISRRRVFATNVADGFPATVRATGKWALRVCEDAP